MNHCQEIRSAESPETDGPSRKTAHRGLLDDLDDAASSRFDQNRATIHYCVSVLADTILRRHVVISNTFFRENRPNSQIFAILIRRASLFDDIRTEARTLIDPEDAGYAANDATDHAANNCSDRTSRPFTISCTPFDTTGDTLGLGRNWKQHRGNNGSGSNTTADHGDSL
jgi:hypothetical protein